MPDVKSCEYQAGCVNRGAGRERRKMEKAPEVGGHDSCEARQQEIHEWGASAPEWLSAQKPEKAKARLKSNVSRTIFRI